MTNRHWQDRLQDAFWQTAEHLLYHHTNPWELDEALVEWGYAIGPCEAQDLIGLDKILTRAPARPTPVLARMVAEGRMGKKGGVGFYRYPGGGGAVVDPLIEDLILEEAWFGKVARSEMEDAALVAAMNGSIRTVLRQYDGPDALSDVVAALHFPRCRANAVFDAE